MKFRNYIDFVILACCGIIAFNVHPSNLIYGDDNSSNNNKTEKTRMIYVFHDYEWNEYVRDTDLGACALEIHLSLTEHADA